MGEQISYLFIYLAEAVIAWLYFDYLFVVKRIPPTLIFTFAGGYMALYFVRWIQIVAINGTAFFVVNLLLLYANYHCKLRSAVLHSAFLTSVMAITEIVAAWLIRSFGFEFDAYASSLSVMIVMAVISKLLYFSITVVAAKFLSPNNSVQEEPAIMGLLCSLPILSAGISVVVVYIGIHSEMTASVETLMVTIVLTLLIVNLIFIVLYNHMQRLHADHLTMQLSLQREEADTAYYEALQEQAESQRILIHDIKSHLYTIAALARTNGSEAISDYIAKLDKTLLPQQHSRMCSDPILNLVLLQFRERCRKQNIAFQCDVRENCLTTLDAPSITSLYGNLLSNAIESAESSADRTIELSVTRNEEQEIIIISVVNSCDTASVPDANGRFRTRKLDRGIHGVGLKSIQRIVDRHMGVSTMYYESEHKRFHHIIQLPMR